MRRSDQAAPLNQPATATRENAPMRALAKQNYSRAMARFSTDLLSLFDRTAEVDIEIQSARARTHRTRIWAVVSGEEVLARSYRRTPVIALGRDKCARIDQDAWVRIRVAVAIHGCRRSR